MPRKMDESAPNHKAGMLVLTRRTQESVFIEVPENAVPGDIIQVIVTSLQENKVRIGFIAPKSYNIDREEIYLAKKKGQRDAYDQQAEG